MACPDLRSPRERVRSFLSAILGLTEVLLPITTVYAEDKLRSGHHIVYPNQRQDARRNPVARETQQRPWQAFLLLIQQHENDSC